MGVFYGSGLLVCYVTMDSSWCNFFSELNRLFDSCQNQIGVANERYVNYAIERLEHGFRSVSIINEKFCIACEPQSELEPDEEEILLRYKHMTDELSTCILSLLCYWDTYLDQLGSTSVAFRYEAQLIHGPGRGRPNFCVERTQIEYLRTLNFSWTEIGELLGVSRMILYRRKRDYGILETPNRAVSNAELTGLLQQLRHDCGETMTMGHLRAMGVMVSRDRVRSVIRRIDPLNIALRWRQNTTYRQPYSVPRPNSLWHLGKV